MNDTVRREIRLHQTDPVHSRIVLLSGVDDAGFLSVASKTPNDLFGWYVAPIGDLDLDGFEDLAVTAPASLIAEGLGPNDPGGPVPAWRGRVQLVSGATGAELATIFNPEATFDSIFGLGAAAVPDQDNDGIPDLLVGGMRIVVPATPEHPNNMTAELRWWVMSIATGEPIRLGLGFVGSAGCEFLLPGPPAETVEEFWVNSEFEGLREVLPGIAGDLDGDGDVDSGDATTLIGEWTNGTTGQWRIGDLNSDGEVNAADLAILLSQIGFPPSLADAFGDEEITAARVNPDLKNFHQCSGCNGIPCLQQPGGCDWWFHGHNWGIGPPDPGGGGDCPGCPPPQGCTGPCCTDPNSCACNPAQCVCNPCCVDPCGPGCYDNCDPSLECFNPPGEHCESHCLPCSPDCGINDELYSIELALDTAHAERNENEFVAVAWANDDDDNINGDPDFWEGAVGTEEYCEQEDDLVPINIWADLCGSEHVWRIVVRQIVIQNENLPTQFPEARARVWYRCTGGVDPILENVVPIAATVAHTRQRIINGELYRSISLYEEPYEGDSHGSPHWLTYKGWSVLGNPAALSGRLFVEFIGRGRLGVGIEVNTVEPQGYSRYVSPIVACKVQSMEVHDLAAWGPGMDSQGNPTIASMALEAHGREIGGAITDGASLCLFRLDSPEAGVSPIRLTMMKRGVTPSDPTHTSVGPEVGGTMHTANPTSLPLLPTSINPTTPPSIVLQSGKAFYVPPDTFLNRTSNPWPDFAHWHGVEETCLMSLVGALDNGQVVRGGRSFVLRRPPILLVHGLFGSAANYWGPQAYDEMSGKPVPTRMYYVDYQATNTKGYSENFHMVPQAIQQILREYRFALGDLSHPARPFNSIRYAATRVDAIGHSMGGQLIRTYVSYLDARTTGAENNRQRDGEDTEWAEMNFRRSPIGDSGNFAYMYLRGDNWGAGDIRRIITIGSPFRGSSLANLAEQYLEPTASNFLLHQAAEDFAPLPTILWPTGTVTHDYVQPTAVADLAEGSTVQQRLSSFGEYPHSRRNPSTRQLVGIALAQHAPGIFTGTDFDILFGLAELLGASSSVPEPIGATGGDLIVHRYSQANVDNEITYSRPQGAIQFFGHVHTDSINPGSSYQAETTSVVISNEIGRLLGMHRMFFDGGALHE